MEEWHHDIGGIPLFAGIAPEQYGAALECLAARQREYPKGAFLYTQGQRVEGIGILLWGSAQVLREDALGNRDILATLEGGDMFAETFAFAGVQTMPVGVFTETGAGVLWFDPQRLTRSESRCAFHPVLVGNMLSILAGKALALNGKLEHLTKRSTREKLLSYLAHMSRQAGNRRFAIPFNRQELADYLAVDRSALSAELSRMAKEGLLWYRKNEFELLAHLGGV